MHAPLAVVVFFQKTFFQKFFWLGGLLLEGEASSGLSFSWLLMAIMERACSVAFLEVCLIRIPAPLKMDDQEQRQNALASLEKFWALSALAKVPEAEEIAKELEEERRSKARNKLIGAGKVRGAKISESISNTL